MSTVAQHRRALARSGIPVDPDLSQPLPKRLLKSRMFWLTLIMLGVYLTLLILLYRQVVPDQPVPGGTLPGLGTEAIPLAAKYAAITARSEEHTSELQSRQYLVCRLLLEKK